MSEMFASQMGGGAAGGGDEGGKGRGDGGGNGGSEGGGDGDKLSDTPAIATVVRDSYRSCCKPRSNAKEKDADTLRKA